MVSLEDIANSVKRAPAFARTLAFVPAVYLLGCDGSSGPVVGTGTDSGVVDQEPADDTDAWPDAPDKPYLTQTECTDSFDFGQGVTAVSQDTPSVAFSSYGLADPFDHEYLPNAGSYDAAEGILTIHEDVSPTDFREGRWKVFPGEVLTPENFEYFYSTCGGGLSAGEAFNDVLDAYGGVVMVEEGRDYPHVMIPSSQPWGGEENCLLSEISVYREDGPCPLSVFETSRDNPDFDPDYWSSRF